MFSLISAFVGLALAASPMAAGQATTVANQINTSNTTGNVVAASAINNDNVAAISFDGNGGTGYCNDLIIPGGGTGDASAPLPTSGFTRDGYKLTGWNTSANGTGTHFALGQTVTAHQVFALDSTGSTSGLILYAEWTKNAVAQSYTISLGANGGNGIMNAFVVEAGKSTYVPPNPFIRARYDFTGWNTSPDGNGVSYTEGSTITPTGNMTLYAQWKETTVYYTITTNANGGTGTPADTITAQRDAKVIAPANTFTRSGYDFDGWNTVANGSGAVISPGATLPATGDTVLYAQWVKKPDVQQYTVKFNENGGNGSMNAITGDENTTVKLPANGFTRDGYEFLGWGTSYEDSGSYLQPDTDYKLTADATLYAQWKLTTPEDVKYMVKFDNNGGTGTLDSSEGTKSDGIKLPASTFVKDGYTFKEWNTKADGTGTSYKAGDTFHPSENSTLYAQWSKNPSDDNSGDHDNNGGSDTNHGGNTDSNGNNGGSSNNGSTSGSNPSKNNGTTKNDTSNGSTTTGKTNGSTATKDDNTASHNDSTGAASKSLQGTKDKAVSDNTKASLGKTGVDVVWIGVSALIAAAIGVVAMVIRRTLREDDEE